MIVFLKRVFQILSIYFSYNLCVNYYNNLTEIIIIFCQNWYLLDFQTEIIANFYMFCTGCEHPGSTSTK